MIFLTLHFYEAKLARQKVFKNNAEDEIACA